MICRPVIFWNASSKDEAVTVPSGLRSGIGMSLRTHPTPWKSWNANLDMFAPSTPPRGDLREATERPKGGFSPPPTRLFQITRSIRAKSPPPLLPLSGSQGGEQGGEGVTPSPVRIWLRIRRRSRSRRTRSGTGPHPGGRRPFPWRRGGSSRPCP